MAIISFRYFLFKKIMQKTKKYYSEMASSLCLKERAKAPQIRILHLTANRVIPVDHIFFKNINNGSKMSAIKAYFILIN